ncbi:ROK family protein [Phycicoccus endophyticus]|uniref:ROK family protein n=1 Tax=Phycicoccus endophyticus TaxID=1690220 RepID=A0A7G9QZE2_9MICO|nr:ROK family protein [Phycicoccus endophyticus]NHI19075.1 ROK family protein [Phycicoccus endophyticus]QNN48717.1 ROK family protein [Phycicoccus endophyticus]GGL32613.1 ROK family protein [Phycicoccus endophyticus]
MSPRPRRAGSPTAVLPADGRRANLSLVLQTLRRLGPTSRAQLAREVGVTKVTMSDLVAELIADGRVRDAGTAEQVGPGKPATLVDLDRSGLLTLAVDLSVPARPQAAVVDVTGEVLAREERDTAAEGVAGRGLDPQVVVDLVRSVLASAPHPVLGIGIGTPGLVDPDGRVRTAPNLGWRDVALRDLVADATGVPVVVLNDSDAATQAELSASPESLDMVLVQVGRGVGCGVVSDGRLVRGAHHAAGEIGHVTVGTDGGQTCSCGRQGCLETWLSAPRLRAAVEAGSDPADPEGVVAVGGHRLAVALAPLVAALDLSEVVLAGPAALLEPVAPVVARSLAERLLPSLDTPLSVRLATSPEDIVLRGAAASVLWDRLGVV